VPARRRLNRAQRRLIRITSIVVITCASAWAVYAYIASAPERALSRDSEGIRLLAARDYQSAISQFTKAIEISPDFADAYRSRGEAWHAAGNDDAALADFERAIALDAGPWLTYISRGVLWISRGENQRALADFTQSIRLHPTSEAYYQRGLTYQTMNQPKRSVEDYDQAIERDPGAPYSYRARAQARRDLGDAVGAREDQEKAQLVDRTQ
jgi:tetratricopeptide (TPR) repeat protein